MPRTRYATLAAVNGTRLHYRQAGAGPDLVMVHGLAANLAFWYLKAVPALSRTHKVTVYDLRGHGGSDMPPSGYRPEDMAADLLGLLDHLNIERADLVGHSFGGAVVLEFAARHPERVRSITLADATIYSLQPLDMGHDQAYWDTWRGQLKTVGIEVPDGMPKVAYGFLEELAQPRWQAMRQRRPRGGDFFVPFGLWNGARRTADRWIALLKTTTAWQEMQSGGVTLDDLKAIDRPALLIYGERSRWIRTSEILRETIPASERVLLANVGHFFPILRPQLFLSHVTAFLDRVPQEPALNVEERIPS